MKVRIRGNSLRFRLTRSEVKTWVETGGLSDSIALAADVGASLTYGLILHPETTWSVHFHESRLEVSVPEPAARQWAQTEQVGLEHSFSWGLRVAVEKDFHCLEHRPGEDDSDAFDRPRATGKSPPSTSPT